MANTLKIKRGAAASIPTGQLAEPLFTSDTYDLYIGTGASNQRFQKYIASGTSSQFLKGDGSLDSTSYQTALTFSSPLVNTSGTISIPAATGSVNGYLTSTDWTTFNSKEPAITAGTTLQYYRGDKTFQTLDTAAVPENGAVYFTEPRVRATVLTGLNLTGGGTIAATDSVLAAFGKVQNQISALVGGATYQGTWNASTNTPTLTSGTGTKGYYYVVSVAGSTNLDGITDWKIGDWAIFNGTTWDKVDNTDAVSSVNGFTGAVNLALDNISDVSAASPTNAQLLRFNGTSSLWENWTPTFEPALTKGNLTEATSSVLTITGGTGAVIGSGTTIQVASAGVAQNGVVTTSAQTFAGVKTFSSTPVVPALHLADMTAGTGALYYNTSEKRLTLANYNTDGILMFEVNSGVYAMAINADLSIRMHGYTTNGFVKFSSSNGTLTVDTNTYLTTSSASSTYVPYSGANTNVNLGIYGLTAGVHLIANYNDQTPGVSASRDVIQANTSFTPSGSGNVKTDWKNFNASFTINTTGTLTNYYGYYATAPTVTSGTITNKYSFYGASGAGIGYFADGITLAGTLSGTSASFSGNVSAARFTPTGATIPTIGMYSSASNYLDFSTNGTRAITISDGQKVGIGADPISAYRLYVNGDIYASATVYGSSASFVGTGTFGSSISATSATFSRNDAGNISVTIANAYINQGNLINFQHNTAGTTTQGYIGHGGDNTGNFVILNNGITAVSFARATGAATFSSDVVLSYNKALAFNSITNQYITADASFLYLGAGNQWRLKLDASTGAATFSSTLRVQDAIYGADGTSTSASIRFWNANTGLYHPGSDALGIITAGTEKMRITSGGNVGIGTTSPTNYTNFTTLHINGKSGSSGGVLRLTAFDNSSSFNIYAAGSAANFNTTSAIPYVFMTQDTPRMTITSAGDILTAGTTNNNPAENNVAGASLYRDGRLFISANGSEVIRINRMTNDGALVYFHQAGVAEGDISVSGTTVSYNGGHLSRYSQTESGQRVEGLLKGTVMSNLDKMAEWINPETGQPYANEQLNCMKVSDVEGDINVAGVFVNWDEDDKTFTNDMNIAMTGDMIIRIAKDVVVERGQLLMSAGDGTAKPQGDDIIRDKTIAKVTSNHVTCVYEDGSYCVPCVLMAC